MVKDEENKNIRLTFKEPDHYPWTDPHNDGALSDLEAYVTYPAGLGKRFDLIYIDGRARYHCLKVARRLVKDDGVIVVHDAARGYYFDDPENRDLSVNRFFLDDKEYNGIWLGSHDARYNGFLEPYRIAWMSMGVLRSVVRRAVHLLHIRKMLLPMS